MIDESHPDAANHEVFSALARPLNDFLRAFREFEETSEDAASVLRIATNYPEGRAVIFHGLGPWSVVARATADDDLTVRLLPALVRAATFGEGTLAYIRSTLHRLPGRVVAEQLRPLCLDYLQHETDDLFTDSLRLAELLAELRDLRGVRAIQQFVATQESDDADERQDLLEFIEGIAAVLVQELNSLGLAETP